METETFLTIALIVGVLNSPIYAIIFWRLKISREIEIKLTKICTFLKLEFPEKAKQVFS